MTPPSGAGLASAALPVLPARHMAANGRARHVACARLGALHALVEHAALARLEAGLRAWTAACGLSRPHPAELAVLLRFEAMRVVTANVRAQCLADALERWRECAPARAAEPRTSDGLDLAAVSRALRALGTAPTTGETREREAERARERATAAADELRARAEAGALGVPRAQLAELLDAVAALPLGGSEHRADAAEPEPRGAPRSLSDALQQRRAALRRQQAAEREAEGEGARRDAYGRALVAPELERVLLALAHLSLAAALGRWRAAVARAAATLALHDAGEARRAHAMQRTFVRQLEAQVLALRAERPAPPREPPVGAPPEPRPSPPQQARARGSSAHARVAPARPPAPAAPVAAAAAAGGESVLRSRAALAPNAKGGGGADPQRRLAPNGARAQGQGLAVPTRRPRTPERPLSEARAAPSPPGAAALAPAPTGARALSPPDSPPGAALVPARSPARPRPARPAARSDGADGEQPPALARSPSAPRARAAAGDDDGAGWEGRLARSASARHLRPARGVARPGRGGAVGELLRGDEDDVSDDDDAEAARRAGEPRAARAQAGGGAGAGGLRAAPPSEPDARPPDGASAAAGPSSARSQPEAERASPRRARAPRALERTPLAAQPPSPSELSALRALVASSEGGVNGGAAAGSAGSAGRGGGGAAHRPLDSLQLYTLGRTLGRGAFGAVKAGVHRLSGQLVAVKCYKKADVRTEADLRALRREVEILRALPHEHVSRLLEVVDSRTHLYLVMEIAISGDLETYLRARCPQAAAGGLAEPEAGRLFVQACEGIGACHAHMIVHRDIKPANLLLHAAGRLTVTDFGLSARTRPGQLLRVPCGTPAHAAPEILQRQPYDGFLSDSWSLGVLLYELLHGQLPFSDTRAIMRAEPRVSAALSPEPAALVHALLVRLPAERARLADVRRGAWYERAWADARAALPARRRLGVTHAEPDERIVRRMESEMGYAAEHTRRVLGASGEAGNDHAAATYALLEQAGQAAADDASADAAASR